MKNIPVKVTYLFIISIIYKKKKSYLALFHIVQMTIFKPQNHHLNTLYALAHYLEFPEEYLLQ